MGFSAQFLIFFLLLKTEFTQLYENEVFGFCFFFNLEPKDGIFRGKRTGSGRTERDVQGPQGLLAFQRAMPYVL